MVKRALTVLAFLGCLALAASDPFVGGWKFDQAKSQFSGQTMKVTVAGNKFTFDDGNIQDTVTADGTDQPVHFGRTMSLVSAGPNAWKSVTKENGRVIVTQTFTVSSDGKSLQMAEVENRADGSTLPAQENFTRAAGATGLGGAWKSEHIDVKAPFNLTISSYQNDGLTLLFPEDKDSLSLKFDGKDYPETGPNVPKGATTSARRADPHTVDLTDKIGGKTVDNAVYKVSTDGNTLTMTVTNVGQRAPLVIVYDRQ